MIYDGDYKARIFLQAEKIIPLQYCKVLFDGTSCLLLVQGTKRVRTVARYCTYGAIDKAGTTHIPVVSLTLRSLLALPSKLMRRALVSQ